MTSEHIVTSLAQMIERMNRPSDLPHLLCLPGRRAQQEYSSLGLARSFTGAIERGEKDLRLTSLVKLANTFEIPPSSTL